MSQDRGDPEHSRCIKKSFSPDLLLMGQDRVTPRSVGPWVGWNFRVWRSKRPLYLWVFMGLPSNE